MYFCKMSEVIQINQLTKYFPGREKPVLDQLSLHIDSGEIVGLLGPNGAGKTTLISILYGLIKPASGNFQIMGMDFKANRRKIQALIGVVPQEYALYPTLTADENLFYFGSLYHVPRTLLRERINSGLEQVGLTAFRDKRIETFSGGMKRRINLLAALLHRPKILFLDEPTVGVDVHSKESIIHMLEEENRKEGTTILYTSHHLNEAQHFCTRIAIIDEGKIIQEGQPDALISAFPGTSTLEEVFIHLTGSELRDYV